MKVSVPKVFLDDAVKKAKPLIKERSPYFYASKFMLKTEMSKLAVLANNSENSVEVSVYASVYKEGSVLVPADLFFKVVSSLPDDEDVSIDVNSNFRMFIKAGKSEIELQGEDPKYFPVINKEGEESFKMDPDILKKSLEHVMFACSKLEGSTISGVYIGVNDNKEVEFVALDGTRIGYMKHSYDTTFQPIIIPSKTANLLLKYISNLEEEISISKSGNNVVFVGKNWVLTSLTLSGDYPKFKTVLDKNNYIHKFTANKKEILEALSIIKAFKFDVVILEYEDGNLSLKSMETEKGFSKQTIIMLDNQIKENIQIAFNPDFLFEVLNVIDDDVVEIQFSDPISPIKVTPTSYEYLYLMMPIRL